MAIYTRDLTGTSAPIIQKMQIREAMATAGVGVEVGADNGSGVSLVETNTAVDSLGFTLDTQATLVTAQQSDNSDPERQVSVIINPLAVWRGLMTQGTTNNTALTLQTENTGSTTGLIVTSGNDFSFADESTIWGFSGANAGVVRKISVGDATNADVTVAFPFDISVGDTFIAINVSPMRRSQVFLSASLDQVDISQSVATAESYQPINIIARDQAEDGRTNSWVEFVARDHCYGPGSS